MLATTPRLAGTLQMTDDLSGIVVIRFKGDVDYASLERAGLQVLFVSPVVAGLVYCRVTRQLRPFEVDLMFDKTKVEYRYPEKLYALRAYKGGATKSSYQWHHKQLHTADVKATGAGTTIAIIDASFNLTVSNLQATGGAYWAGNNFVGNLASFPVETTNSHGTLCASLAVGKAVANFGVGVAPGAEFLAFAIADAAQSDSQTRLAWAIQIALAPVAPRFDFPAANIISVSITPGANESTGAVPITEDLDDALIAAAKQNVLVVWAVANTPPDAKVSDDLPASHSAVLNAGAVNQAQQFSGATLPTVTAGVAGTRANNCDDRMCTVGNENSFAAPIVAGVAALVWSTKPTLTATQVRDALLGDTPIKAKITRFDGTEHDVPVADALYSVSKV